MSETLNKIKKELLKRYPDGNVKGLSSKHKKLYQQIYRVAKEDYNKSIKDFIKEDLDLDTSRKRKYDLEKLKRKLEKLYPSKVVENLSSTDIALYRKIYSVARNNFNMDVNVFMEDVLDFTVDKYPETFIDTKTLEYIGGNFDNFKHSLINEHLPYTRQRYFEKIKTRVNYTGDWVVDNLPKHIILWAKDLVATNKDYEFLDGELLKILYNPKDNFCILYIDFNKETGYFSKIFNDVLLRELKEKKYDTLYREEYLLYTKLKESHDPVVLTQDYYELVTSEDTISTLRGFALKYGYTSLEDYIENKLNLEYVPKNSNSPKKMKEYLSRFIIKKPNYVHIDTSNISLYSNLTKKARRLYPGLTISKAFQNLCKRYGFIHIATENNIYAYKSDLLDYEVSPGKLYLPSSTSTYLNFYNYCRRRDLSIDEGLLELDLERLEFAELSTDQLENINLENDDEIEIGVSNWVKERHRLGLEAEEEAYSILKGIYNNVQKVPDYKGFDFRCDTNFVEVKSFSVRPTIFISSNQLKTMANNPKKYMLFLYNRETKKYWIFKDVLNVLGVKLTKIVNDLSTGKNEIFIEKIKVKLDKALLGGV